MNETTRDLHVCIRVETTRVEHAIVSKPRGQMGNWYITTRI